jgi:hypothetical protein
MTHPHATDHRSVRRVAAGVFVAMTLAAGCGSSESSTSDSTSSDTTDPTPEETTVTLPDPSTPVVQLRTQAMFPITPPFLPTEWTTVAADGTVLVPFRGNFAVQPQVWPFEIGHVDVTRVEGLLAGAGAAGLLDDPAGISTNPSVVDGPRTTVIITTADRRVVHVADALGSGETDPFRAALQAFIGQVATLVMDATAKPDDDSRWPVFHEPDALDIVAVEVTEEAPGAGTPRIVEWTADAVDLSAASSCTTITDSDAIAFLTSQMAGPQYRQGDRLYRVASRIHPPGTSCDD